MMTSEEKEAYEAYKDRLSMPMCPNLVPKDENKKYNEEHPVPSEDEIQKILKEANY